MRRLWPVVVVAVGVGVACERNNARYCDASHLTCAADETCNLATNECESPGGNDDLGGLDLSGIDFAQSCMPACTGTTPVCVSSACAGCNVSGDGELACTAIFPSTPHCQTVGSAAGSCVACRDNGDCPTAGASICDPQTHQCRGCAADIDCPSLVCDLTPGSATLNSCVPPNKVVYVDCVTGSDMKDGLSVGAAVKKITVGAMKATQAGATVVRIATGLCNRENLPLNNVNLTFVGVPNTVITAKDPNNPDVELKGNCNVIFRGLTFSGATGSPAAGIVLSSAGANVTVLQCKVANNAEYGIDANNNTTGKVTVDRSIITGNIGGGMRISSGGLRVINSFLVGNGSDTVAAGGAINMVANTTLAREIINNTIADNKSSAVYTGIECPTPTNAVVKNNILYNNLAQGTLNTTDCPGDNNCADILPIGVNNQLLTSNPFLSATDYHLSSSAICRDKGTSTGAPTYDFDGEPRPNGSGLVDIGADEIP